MEGCGYGDQVGIGFFGPTCDGQVTGCECGLIGFAQARFMDVNVAAALYIHDIRVNIHPHHFNSVRGKR